MRAGRLLVLLACAVAALAYVGAVTTPALVTLVLPEVLVVGLVALVAARHLLAGLVAVMLCAGAVGEVVNVLSGDYQGSVARSAFGAGLLGGLAVILAGTRRPASFLVPLVGIVAWALALGAGGRVALVAVVAGGLGAVALATLEREDRRYVTPPGLVPTVALVLLLTVAAGIAAAVVQLRVDSRDPAAPLRSSQTLTVHPPPFLSLTKHPPRSATAKPPVADTVPSSIAQLRQEKARSRKLALIAVFSLTALVLSVMSVVLLYRLWVALTWRLLRRRLRSRAPSAEIGAWIWVLAVAQRLGQPLPLSASPDVVMTEPISDAMQALAGRVALAAFGPAQSPGTEDCWGFADSVSGETWAAAARRNRVRARFRRPQRTAGAH